MTKRWLVLALGLVVLTASRAGAWAPLDPQDPLPDPSGTGQLNQSGLSGQRKGQVPEPLKQPGTFERLPAIDESPYVVIATLDRPYWSAGKPDAVLSNACKQGDFATVPLNRIVIRYNGPPVKKGAGPNDASTGRGTLQVVPPDYRHLLVDNRHLARPNETYFFFASAGPDCQVWVRNPSGPQRKLNSVTGSSLPPAKPGDLAKEKATIASWPKK